MLKKAFLAATLCVTASFASWDRFPVLENHKGEFAVGVNFSKLGERMWLLPFVGSRYTVVPNLELGVSIPYYIRLYKSNVNGLANPRFMVRYQFLPMLNAFLNVRVPISNDPYNYSDWAFNFGTQYSQNFGVVDFGSELGLTVCTRGDDKESPPLHLNFGAEADFNLGIPLTPFIGANVLMRIGKYTYKGKNYGKSYTGDFVVRPYAGLKYAINSNVSVQTSVITELGKEEVVGPETLIGVTLELKVSF